MSRKVVLQTKFTADVIDDFLAEVKKALLEDKEDITIDMSQVEKIDTAGVQLTLVLLHEAKTLGRNVSFENSVSREVLQKFMMGGFISPDVKDGKELRDGLLSLMS